MKRIALYSRKSKETDRGESTKIQIKICMEYFNKYTDCKFEVFEDDGYSGGNTNRPEFKRMMLKVKADEFDIVAAYKLDRVARNINDFFNIYNELEDYGVSLVSVTEGFDPSTPIGKMMMVMLAAFADMERENIRQRVKDNMRELAKQGKWSGGNAPIGYEAIRVIENGKKYSCLKLKDVEKIIVEDIYNLYLDGFSTRKIATMVNKKYNLSTSQRRIGNILYSPIYVGSTEYLNKYLEMKNYLVCGEPNGFGYLTYQKTKIMKNGSKVLDRDNKTIAAPSKHEPIIPSDKWVKVQEKLKENTQNPKPHISKYTWLAHLVKCGYCGTNTHVYNEGSNRNNRRYFKKNCKCKQKNMLTIEKAEAYILEFLSAIDSSESLDKIVNNKDKPSTTIKEVNLLKKELIKLDNMITGLTDKLSLASDNTIEVLLNRLDSLVTQKKSLQEQLLILEKKQNFETSTSINKDMLLKEIQLFVKDFKLLNMSEKQLHMKKILKAIYWNGVEKKISVEFIEL